MMRIHYLTHIMPDHLGRIAKSKKREGVVERFEDPSVQKMIATDYMKKEVIFKFGAGLGGFQRVGKIPPGPSDPEIFKGLSIIIHSSCLECRKGSHRPPYAPKRNRVQRLQEAKPRHFARCLLPVIRWQLRVRRLSGLPRPDN